ncbi:MAG: hypothetical protein LBS86_03900 [Treponema sp.]|jgi:hypothetical protein|nr:hypothetical protein [Treponema sp.]
MARKFGFLLVGVCLVFSTLGFIGCKDEEESFVVDDHKLNPLLIGTWNSEYGDTYTINTEATLIYDSGVGGSAPDSSYEGTVCYDSNFTSDAGVIIIKYTDAPQYGVYDANYTLTDTLDPAGSFIGIYYKDLTSTSVSMAGAYTMPSGAEKTTLAAAISAFTAGNAGDYIYSYSTCSKQP